MEAKIVKKDNKMQESKSQDKNYEKFEVRRWNLFNFWLKTSLQYL